jgi:hypothetical protein
MAANDNQADAGNKGPAGRSTKGRPSVVQVLLALVGLGLVGVGVAAIFTTKSNAGAAALVVVGSVLVLFAAFGDRLESIRYGDLEFRLRRAADEAAGRGDLETAKALERAADALHQRVTKAARAYTSLRGEMPPGPERTAKMEAIIAEAQAGAHARDIDEEEVLRLLWTGSEGARVWALGVLEARPELATPRAVLEAVQHPDEMFDQYHALVLADLFLRLPTTRAWTRVRVAGAVRFQL